MKVIQVITDTNIGGAGIWLLNFLSSYDREKIDMTVIVPEHSALRERVEELGVRVKEAAGTADSSFSAAGVRSIRRILAEEKPDVVHTHASLSARIAAKTVRGVRTVNTRHCLESAKTGIGKVVYGFINNTLSDRVIAVSGAVAENLRADGISAKKLRTVYNGIRPPRALSDGEKLAVREKYGIAPDAPVIGIVARLEPVKGHGTFLDMAEAVLKERPDAVFMIVGDGSAADGIKADAERRGLGDRVIFTGYLRDVTEVMNVIDIHTLTSRHEALSISLIEGMSLGKVALSTDAGGPREVIEDGVSGRIVPVGDGEALARAVLYYLNDSEAARKAGEVGKRIAREKFSVEEMARRIESVYEELV